jgi:hypothetical protein
MFHCLMGRAIPGNWSGALGNIMSVTAKQLSKSGARGKELDTFIREQVQIIDDRLQRADRMWGRNVVSVNLPVTFSLPGLEKRDAQRIVYSAIIRSLDSRGFETKILLEEDETILYVAWMTDLDVAEVAAMTALIKAKRLARPEVDAFVSKGAFSAPRSATEAKNGRTAPATPMSVTESERIMQPRGGVGDAPSSVTRAVPGPISRAEAAILGTH